MFEILAKFQVCNVPMSKSSRIWILFDHDNFLNIFCEIFDARDAADVLGKDVEDATHAFASAWCY